MYNWLWTCSCRMWPPVLRLFRYTWKKRTHLCETEVSVHFWRLILLHWEVGVLCWGGGEVTQQSKILHAGLMTLTRKEYGWPMVFFWAHRDKSTKQTSVRMVSREGIEYLYTSVSELSSAATISGPPSGVVRYRTFWSSSSSSSSSASVSDFSLSAPTRTQLCC